MPTLIKGESRFFIRRMQEADLAAVRAIEAQSFSNPWSDNTFRGEIQNTPVSFPLVVVRPDCRGLGLGEALMRFAIAKVREAGAAFMTLEVRPSNSAAVALYKKLGFDVLGTRKSYYTKPDEDAHVMGLVLNQ
jgi:ribosomal-protein-alanine N-acetyltransferase